MTAIIGLGAGGHAKVVIETLQLMPGYEIVGLLDANADLWQTNLLGVPILGGDSVLVELYEQGIQAAFIGVGSVGNTHPRQKIYNLAKQQGFNIIHVIHPTAIISPSATFAEGVTIMAGTIINACSQLGQNVIVNSGAIVEHDCVIGDHVHIATGAKLASTVQVGANTHIGVGATIRQCITIGNNVTIGAGAVVIRDLPDNVTAIGVPAHFTAK